VLGTPGPEASLTFCGSVAAQLNDVPALAGDPDRGSALPPSKTNRAASRSYDVSGAAGTRGGATRRRSSFGVPTPLGAACGFDRMRGSRRRHHRRRGENSNGTDDRREAWECLDALVSDHENVLTSVGWHPADPLRGAATPSSRLKFARRTPAGRTAALDRAAWFST